MTIKEKKLKAIHSNLEDFYVFISIIAIIIFSMFLLKLNSKPTKKIEDNTILSTNLSAKDQLIYTNAEIFVEDFPVLYSNGKAPSIVELEDLLYQPFVHDVVWESAGEHTWDFSEDENYFYYVATSDKKDINSFIIKISKMDLKSDIYVTNSKNIENIQDALLKSTLIKSYKGSDYAGGIK